MNTPTTWPRCCPAPLLVEWKHKASTPPLLLLLMLLLGCLLPATFAQTTPESASEEAVKAAFIYRFLNYVEWPPGAQAGVDVPYMIGVVNADDVADELQDIVARRRVNNRAIELKRLGASDSTAGLHVLFVGSSARAAAWTRRRGSSKRYCW